jgi:phosphoribosylglycinamide formyltransferase-1
LINICILASGGGSNAREICEYFQNNPYINIVMIGSNKIDAGVHNIAKQYDVPSYTFTKKQLNDKSYISNLFSQNKIDYIVLAGFLLLIPEFIILNYKDRIINIHPSLLPKYGGAGMYGHHVHEAVKVNRESESGMTIHLVNEKYDDGKVLFQAKCAVHPSMTSEEIAAAVLKLEHTYFSQTIENYILGHEMDQKTN